MSPLKRVLRDPRSYIGRLIVLYLVCWPAPASQAQTVPEILQLEEAVALGLTRQPQIEAWEAQALAARESAVADRQLPDPELSMALANVPVTGADALHLRRDEMTQVMVGVSQRFPRGRTRDLRGALTSLRAEAAGAMGEQARRETRRDIGLAWTDAVAGEQAVRLARARHEAALRLSEVAEIAYRAGRISQEEALGARVGAELAADRMTALRFTAQQARSRLFRWIGAAAYRPLPDEGPSLPQPPELKVLLDHAARHPHLDALAYEVQMAQNDIALAQDDYRPAWGMEVYYANRPDFADMVGLRVNVDLPVFTAQRQDRRLAASRLSRDEAVARRDDALRIQAAQVRELWDEHRQLLERVQRFDTSIEPAVRQRVAAAESAYGAGSGAATAVYESRDALLDTELRKLELTTALARTRIRFQYFLVGGAS